VPAFLAPPPAPPTIVAPAPREVSFGEIVGVVGPGTRRLLVTIDGQPRRERAVRRRRFSLNLALPRRDFTLRVTAVDGAGRRASTVVRPIFGLPRGAAPIVRPPAVGGQEDGALARTVHALARRFPGICAAFVQDLGTGVGAAWNARARFPAASTLKVAIALAVLRAHRGKPPPGSRLDRLLRRMLLASDAKAANELLVWLGGSTSGGGARVNATLRALGLIDTEMFGGYEVTRALSRTRKPIPRRVESQPAFGLGKYTTASDLARLMRHLHFAAGGKGLIVRRFRGSVTPSDARFLLFLLAHVRESGRLDRYLGGGTAVLQKAGWIEKARHDSGLVYWRRGAFVATVMTWNPRGAGPSSDVFAGRVARAARDRFRRRARRGVKALSTRRTRDPDPDPDLTRLAPGPAPRAVGS
jgi:Beta-lactamase enzyme family